MIFLSYFIFASAFCMEPGQTFEKFNALPENMQVEIFQQRLITLVQEHIDSNNKDRFQVFFKQLNILSQVNKQFLKSLRFYIPIKEENQFPIYFGESLLAIAIENDWTNLWKFIIDHSISGDLILSQKEKDIALKWFAINKNKLMVKNFIKDIKSEAQPILTYGAVFDPINILENGINIKEHIETLKFSIEYSMPNVDPLDTAIDAIKLLLHNGADANTCDEINFSLLIKSIFVGKYNTTKLLLKYGANVNHKNTFGLTPLMAAVVEKNESIIRLLLSCKNINIDLQDNNGYTALMYACTLGYENIVKLLIEYHPNLDIQNNEGNTALLLSVIPNFGSRFSQIYFNMIMIRTELFGSGNTQTKLELIYPHRTEGIDVIMRTDHRKNIKENIIILLLESGANKNIKNNYNENVYDITKEYMPIVNQMLKKYKTITDNCLIS